MYLYVYSSRALESAHSPAMHESIHDASGLTSWSSDCDIFSEDLVSSQHCSVLQSVAMCCSVLQCVAVWTCIRGTQYLSCVAVCCSVLQCVAACCNVLQCVAVYRSVSQCVDMYLGDPVSFVCCSVSQCVAVCCSVLQRVAAC